MKTPFNVMRHAGWDFAPRDPITIGAAILGSAATAATTVTIFGASVAVGAWVIGTVVTTALTSFALRKLGPKAASGAAENRGTLINARQPAAAHEYVYGQIRKGGIITYMQTTGESNDYLHMVIALAGHEVEEIGDIYVNDEIVSLDGSGFVTGTRWGEKIRIEKFTGSQNSAPANLMTEAGVPASFAGNGIAYIYVRLAYDADIFGGGIPTFTAIVKGKKVYDPRTATTAYSNNAALVIRDYITSATGLNDVAVDDTYFSAAANDCDDAIPLAGGGTQARYTIDGVVNAESTTGNALADMMEACNGALFFSGGVWKMKAGVYSASVKSLTLDDFRSGITLPTRLSRRDNFNRITGKFTDAASGWIETDFPAIVSPEFLAEDGGVENTLDVGLAMVTNAARAQRLAKQKLFRSREQMTIMAEFGLAAMGVEVGDIIDLTIDRYGWSAKEFEVAAWSLKVADNGGVRVAMTLRETSEAAFDWAAEEVAIISNNTTLLDYSTVPDVGLSFYGDLRLVNQQVVGALLISVTSGSAQVDQFEVQYRQSDSDDWISLGRSSSNNFEAVGVSDGFFDVRARGINGFGIRGNWTTISDFYVTIFAIPPQDVTNFSANVVGNSLHLTWTPSPDLDLSHYKIRYAGVTSGASYQNAIDIVKKVSRPANSVVIPAQTGTYFIKAVDKLGNVSALPASIVIDTNVADVEALNVVETLQQDPAFAGTKSEVAVVTDDTGPYLVLDTVIDFDSAEGDFDDASGFFDGGGLGGLASSGTYTFDDYIDLTQKYVSRVMTSMEVEYVQYSNVFDDATGNFDDRAGQFDGDTSQFDTVSVRTQVSYTDDDPAGSPTWTDWRDFIVGDISARAIRFRAILESDQADASPIIRSLSAIIDMPDRVESASDITYTGSQAVTFPAAFKVSPAIGIAASLANGDRYVISGKSRTGFTITTYTGGSVSTNPATFDYVAKGYGKELT